MGASITAGFAFGEVVILEAERSTLHHGLDGLARWPCPGCSTERLLDDSWLLIVRDPDGRHRRNILVCAGCAASAGVPGTFG